MLACVSRRGGCLQLAFPHWTEPTSLENIPCHWHSSFFLSVFSSWRKEKKSERDRAFLFMFGEADNRRRAGEKRWRQRRERWRDRWTSLELYANLRGTDGESVVDRRLCHISWLPLEASSLSRPRSKVSEHRLEQELWWILNGCNNVLHFVTRRLLIMTDDEKWCSEKEIEENLLLNRKRIEPNIKIKLFA